MVDRRDISYHMQIAVDLIPGYWSENGRFIGENYEKFSVLSVLRYGAGAHVS